MDYKKEAGKRNYFELILFVLLGISVIILLSQIFDLTGSSINGNVVNEGNEEQEKIATINSVIELKDAEHLGKD